MKAVSIDQNCMAERDFWKTSKILKAENDFD